MYLRDGHFMDVVHNVAGLNGGAVALLSGARISAHDEPCSSACLESSRGNGICNPECLTSACNWDNGDCVREVFEEAGSDLQHECDRSVCSLLEMTAVDKGCNKDCFTASCDFGGYTCVDQKSLVEKCPILDATVYASIARSSAPSAPLFGGTSQELGICNQSQCNDPLPPPDASDVMGFGRLGGGSLALDGQGSWLNLRIPDGAARWTSASTNVTAVTDVTVEAWINVGERSSIAHDDGGLTFEAHEDCEAPWPWRHPYLPVLSFLYASRDFAIGILTETGKAGNESHKAAWPLVFSGKSQEASCSSEDVVMVSSTGMIDDGPDMIVRSKPLRCSWIIAPPGARSVTLVFTEFSILSSFDTMIDMLTVCTCEDTACEEQSYCLTFSGGEIPRPFTSSTGIMHVSLKTSESNYRSNAGFSAFYSSAFEHSRIDQGVWHHLAVKMEAHVKGNQGNGSRPAVPRCNESVLSVFVDGDERCRSVLPWAPSHIAAFGDELGIAIGRRAPQWQSNLPLDKYQKTMQHYVALRRTGKTLQPGRDAACADSYYFDHHAGRFNGSIDELRVWESARSAAQIKASKDFRCSDLHGSVAACYSFDGNSGESFLRDESGQARVKAFTASGLSPHLPWCESRNDGGVLASTISSSAAESLPYVPASWGFCKGLPRLPGAGIHYDEEQMQAITSHVSSGVADVLSQYPGCGHLVLNISLNKAGSNGGGIFVEGCFRRDKCFLDGLGQYEGSRAMMLDRNVAASGGGGGIYVACHELGPECESALHSGNKLGALPLVPKISRAGNTAIYGDDFASEPKYLAISPIGDEHGSHDAATAVQTVVPGQEKLTFSAKALDASRTWCKSLHVVASVVICGEQDSCEQEKALSAEIYFSSSPSTGLIEIGLDLVCAVSAVSGQDEYTTLEVSLVQYGEAAKQRFRVQCKSCSNGQSRTLNSQGNSWKCVKCNPNEYILDPNNVAHRCSPCPKQAVCDGNDMKPQVGELGVHWEADPATGVYTLVGCPKGYALSNAECLACKPGEYCIGGNREKYTCPKGTHSSYAAFSQEDCFEAQMVSLTVGMPMSLLDFTRAEERFKLALGDAAGTDPYNVIIVSVRQIDGRRNEAKEAKEGRRNAAQPVAVAYGSSNRARVEIVSEVAAPSNEEALKIKYSLSADSMNEHFLMQGLPAAIVLSEPKLETDKRASFLEPGTIGLLAGDGNAFLLVVVAKQRCA